MIPAIKSTLAVASLLLLLTTACGGVEPTEVAAQAEAAAEPVATTQTEVTAQDEVTANKEVRGLILDVVARNIIEIELLTIRDDAGQEYTFTTNGFVEVTPSHLKEHQLFGQKVLVKYVEQGGRLVALEVLD